MINQNKNITINKIIAEFETHLPYNQILNNHEKEQFTVDGVIPSIVICPTNHSQIQLILEIAKKNNLGIIPFGGGTKINLGNIPEKFDIALSTRNLNSIINHQQFDLTTTVEAGITLFFIFVVYRFISCLIVFPLFVIKRCCGFSLLKKVYI